MDTINDAAFGWDRVGGGRGWREEGKGEGGSERELILIRMFGQKTAKKLFCSLELLIECL
jgi:hypothetical protein